MRRNCKTCSVWSERAVFARLIRARHRLRIFLCDNQHVRLVSSDAFLSSSLSSRNIRNCLVFKLVHECWKLISNAKWRPTDRNAILITKNAIKQRAKKKIEIQIAYRQNYNIITFVLLAYNGKIIVFFFLQRNHWLQFTSFSSVVVGKCWLVIMMYEALQAHRNKTPLNMKSNGMAWKIMYTAERDEL